MSKSIREILRLIGELREDYLSDKLDADNYFRVVSKLWERYRKLDIQTDDTGKA